MSTALSVIQIIFYSVGILFLITFMIIGIWSFIIYNKIHRSKRVQNYILEKIYQKLSVSEKPTISNDDLFDINSILEDDSLFNDNSLENDDFKKENPMHSE